MKLNISDSIIEKLNIINSMNKGIFLKRKRREKALKILAEPEFSKNPAVIKYLLELVLDKDRAISEIAADCIRKSIATLSIMDFLVLSEDIKSFGYRCPRTRWFSLKEEDISIFNNFHNNKVVLLGLATFKYYGKWLLI